MESINDDDTLVVTYTHLVRQGLDHDRAAMDKLFGLDTMKTVKLVANRILAKELGASMHAGLPDPTLEKYFHNLGITVDKFGNQFVAYEQDITDIDLKNTQDKVQEDLICLLDKFVDTGRLIQSNTIDAACEIVVNRFRPLLNKVRGG